MCVIELELNFSTRDHYTARTPSQQTAEAARSSCTRDKGRPPSRGRAAGPPPRPCRSSCLLTVLKALFADSPCTHLLGTGLPIVMSVRSSTGMPYERAERTTID